MGPKTSLPGLEGLEGAKADQALGLGRLVGFKVVVDVDRVGNPRILFLLFPDVELDGRALLRVQGVPVFGHGALVAVEKVLLEVVLAGVAVVAGAGAGLELLASGLEEPAGEGLGLDGCHDSGLGLG